MLDELVVRNLGVIEVARVEPAGGLTVITGETGTGKTLLVGALRLLLGGESRPELVGPFDTEAVAEGRFVTDDGREVGAGRRMPRDGRSRAYLDGSVASAAALEERTEGLVDLVGQHDHITLTRPAVARSLVDGVLDAAGRRALEHYQAAWAALVDALDTQGRLGGDRSLLGRELELVSYQATEVEGAALGEDEDASLQAQADRLRHADDIAASLGRAGGLLDDSRQAMGEAVAEVRQAARLDSGLEALAGHADAAAEALAELATEVRRAGEAPTTDPARLEEVESRLTLVGDLKRKYGRTLEEVQAAGATAARRRDELAALLGRSEQIDHEVEAARSQVAIAGRELGASRRTAARRLVDAAEGHLAELGFSDAHLTVDIEETEPGPSGCHSMRLLFASDRRLQAREVGKVASGGELSRLVLALRLAAGGGTATLVFDEVDAGIGGGTALALGRKLADLARGRQVLCVTHLPQIAAFADRHYVVHRLGVAASVAEVDGDARLEELARMLAGLPESDRGRQAAEELLDLAAAGR